MSRSRSRSIRSFPFYSACFWIEPNFDSGSERDERILKIVGQDVFILSAIRKNGDYIGFSMKVNDSPYGTILDSPMSPLVWHQICFSFDANGYFRFNYNGETLITQRVKQAVDIVFATKTAITFGSDDKRV